MNDQSADFIKFFLPAFHTFSRMMIVRSSRNAPKLTNEPTSSEDGMPCLPCVPSQTEEVISHFAEYCLSGGQI